MKTLLLLGIILPLTITGASAEDASKNFTIIVDGKSFELNAGETIHGKNQFGHAINITLKRKDFATFASGIVSFEHRSDLSVATSDIDKDIHQHLVSSGLGTMLLVQQYDRMNPDGLADFMLGKITEGDMVGSAKLTKESFSRTLPDGTVVKGLKATVKSVKDDIHLEVLSAAVGDGGVIAMSRIDYELAQAEQPIIDRFWASLRLKK